MISIFHKSFIRPRMCNVIRFLFTLLLLQSAGFFLLFHKQDVLNPSESSPLCCASNRCENPSWKMKPLNNMTLEEILNYVKWTNRSSCSLAHDFGGVVFKPNGIDGQKTVCLDESVRPVYHTSTINPVVESTECLVYSFGINHEWSFDEAMERFGCRVFSFDPSMYIETHNHSEKIHFYNVGLDGQDRIVEILKNNLKTNWTLMSLDSIYRNLLKHEGRIIDYLKIDIEESEWSALPQILSSGMMDNVRQLGVEVHLFPNQKDNCELEDIRKRVKVIQSLEDYGLVRFDSKHNLWSEGWKSIDNVNWEVFWAYEIAWYNSKIVSSWGKM